VNAGSTIKLKRYRRRIVNYVIPNFNNSVILPSYKYRYADRIVNKVIIDIRRDGSAAHGFYAIRMGSDVEGLIDWPYSTTSDLVEDQESV
jgi:hypothetical protein